MMIARGRPWVDGVSAAEIAAPLACDQLVPKAEMVLNRGIDVAAPAPATWRWLCQLRVAPYSYDWIDNFGLRSPRELTAGLDALAVGQRIAVVFRLASWTVGEHLTAAAPANPVLGATAATWAVRPTGLNSCRLSFRMVGETGGVRATALAWGDLPMARRQLRTLAALAAG